ncbi:MAG: [NiFe]-hydrogenase assembly chaperone HybE [Rhodocyclaceae bacterium]|jgi:[NiFe] hydrogenase assembly HybE family chaperone|nr:[NiFe]-hydrogenase assembly chaperone HybE [Rhodocyclaceae bacterium]
MHAENPAARIKAVFRRIHVERMAGLPLLNPALEVAAVGFSRHSDDWRGVLVTPWGINLLLLPAVEDWPVPPPLERAFRQYPAGSFAFLPNHEEGLGDYLACPLISDMKPFADQETALATARACLIALDIAPGQTPADAPGAPDSLERRRFLLRGMKE